MKFLLLWLYGLFPGWEITKYGVADHEVTLGCVEFEVTMKCEIYLREIIEVIILFVIFI